MKWIVDNNGNKHQVRKYIIDREGEESVWCDTWYGHHVIGRDCNWLDESQEVAELKLAITAWRKMYLDVIEKKFKP